MTTLKHFRQCFSKPSNSLDKKQYPVKHCQSMQTITIICTLVAIASCGGGIENPGAIPSNSSLSNSEASSSSTNIGEGSAADHCDAAIARGKVIYESTQACNFCHGDDGSGGISKAIDLEANVYRHGSMSADEPGLPLNEYVAAYMPQPGRCIDQCANDVSAYVKSLGGAPWCPDPNSGSSSSTASSSESESSSNTPPAPNGSISAPPVTIHRLNRAEYNNTVRDLFNTDQRPADNFPDDDFGFGFNNISAVLSVSLSHLEQYHSAVTNLLEEALGESRVFEAEDFGSGGNVQGSFWNLPRTHSKVVIPLTNSQTGTYNIRIIAAEQAGGNANANMAVSLDGNLVQNVSVSATVSLPAEYSVQTRLIAGEQVLELRFTNDFWISGQADRNLLIDKVMIDGPTNAQGLTIPRVPELSCSVTDTRDCVRHIITQFGKRAWRRPLSRSEIDSLIDVFDFAQTKGNSYRDSLLNTLRGLLLSPNFIFRPEIDTDLTATTAENLSPYELASRLSYFIWSSTPDSQLLALADSGEILTETTLRAEVQRMLGSEKSVALIENFAVQWLKFDKVLESEPDLNLFPNYNEELVEAMRQETRLFFKELVNTNAPISHLFTADYSYLNNTLAEHYNISGVNSPEFQKVQWGSAPRRGILGHASVLTATSHPATTSPVRRGNWVLEALLCDEPLPPPPGVENVDVGADTSRLTTREIFQMHQDTSTVCYSCHSVMDPIGFGLENFDPVGQWRTRDGVSQVDAQGTLPNGDSFSGSVELGEVLARSYRLPMCFAEHLVTYALGRGTEAFTHTGEGHEYPLIYDLYQRTLSNGNRINDLIEEIVVSKAFRQRRGANSNGGNSE